MTDSLQDTVGVAASKTAIITGGGTALWGVFTNEVFFGLIGVLVAVITMFINWYYKRKSNKREAEKAELETAILRVRLEVIKNDRYAEQNQNTCS